MIPRSEPSDPVTVSEVEGFTALPGCEAQRLECWYLDDSREEVKCACPEHAPGSIPTFSPEDLVVDCPDGEEPNCQDDGTVLICGCGGSEDASGDPPH